MKRLLLFVLILSLAVHAVYSYFPDNSTLIGGTDTASHLFKTWFIAEKGFSYWSPYWYGGFNFFSHYAPLFYLMTGSIGSFLGTLAAYKLVIDVVFILLPLAFFLLIKEFWHDERKIAIAVLIFALLPVHQYYLYDGRHPALLAFFFSLFYFRILIRGAQSNRNILLASLFLAFTVLSHHLVGFMALVLSLAFVKWDRKGTVALLKIVATAGLISSFWTVPFVLSSLGKPAGASLLGIDVPVTLTSQIIDAHYISNFSYPWAQYTVPVMLSVLTALSVYGLLWIRGPERRFIPFLFLMLIILVSISYNRVLIFAPLPVAILAAEGMYKLKGLWKNALILLGITLLLLPIMQIPAVSYPPVPDVPQDGRVLYLPQNAFTVPYASLYEVFLVPAHGNEYILGWHPESQTTLKLAYLSELSNPDVNPKDYAELMRRGWVNYVVVRKDYQNITFFDSPPFIKYGEDVDFEIFALRNKSTFVSLNGRDADVKVGRKDDSIFLKMECSPGKLLIKESYDKGWTARVNDVPLPIGPDENGFMGLDLKNSGECDITLSYTPYG